MKRLSTICMIFFTFGCAARLGRLNPNVRTERLLAVENRRLSYMKDPVERTLIYIRIAQLIIDSVQDAAHSDDFERMGSLLTDYSSTIRSAQQMMLHSGRNPAEAPEGFTNLELALREEARRLQDISRSLRVDDRHPVELALGTAVSIREGLLRLIFPQTAAVPD